MKCFKRVIASVLASLLVCSALPLQAFADPVITGNGGGGGDGGHGSGGGPNVDASSVSVEKQGYRFTFVDTTTGAKVGRTVDILRSARPVGLTYESSAVENYADQNGDGNYDYYFYGNIEAQIQTFVTNFEHMPWWMTSDTTSNSVPFKQWLFSDESMALISGAMTNLDLAAKEPDKIVSGECKVLEASDAVHAYFAEVMDDLRKVDLGTQKNVDLVYQSITLMEGILNDLHNAKSQQGIGVYSEILVKAVADFRTEIDNKPKATNVKGPATSDVEKSNSYLSWLSKQEDVVKVITTTGKGEGNSSVSIVGNTGGGATSAGDTIAGGAGLSATESVQWGTWKTQMDGHAYDAKQYGYVGPLIYCYDGNESIFTKGTGLTADELGEMFLSNQVSLIVEPILWCCPRNWNTGKNFPQQVYGTPRNWAFAMPVVKALWGYMSDLGLANWRTINIAFLTAMQLEADEDVITSDGSRSPVCLNGVPFKSDLGKNQVKDGRPCYGFELFRNLIIASNNTSGLGMHIYGCKATPPGIPKIDDPSGGPGLPDYPWEDPNKKPIKIVKYYQTRFTDNKILGEAYFVLPNAPRTVEIKDSETKYKYMGYYTSTDDYQIPAGGDPNEWTWDKSLKDCTKGSYGGTTTGILTIPEDAPDKTVLILYERRPEIITKEAKPIHTYNVNENPDYDDYSEPSDNLPDPDTYGDKKNHFSLDKHYRYRDSITNEVTEISYYTTINAPHTVIIQDEREQTGFALKDWFTSTDDWLPPDGGTPSDYNWESVVKGQHKNGKYEGTGETTLTVQPEDPDNVLHLLYEFEGKPFINIVKIYKNEDGSVNHTKGPEPHEDTKKYTVEEDEEGFSYVETLVSTQEPDPGNPNGTPTKSKEINIPEGTKTLYIIYQAKGKQIILYSNELTYTYDLRDLVKERVLFGIYDKAPQSPGSPHSCEVHYCSSDHCSGHTCGAPKSNHKLSSSNNTFGMTVADNFDYNNGTTFILDYVQTTKGGASFSKTWIAQVAGKTPGISDRVKPNYDYVLYRQKDKDLVTLYPKKNDGLSGALSRLGINTTAYTPAGSRAEKEMTKDKYFENHLQTHFDYTAHDTSLTWKYPRNKCHKEHSGDYTTQTVATPQGANDFYSKNPSNVKEYYFVGQSNEGLDTNISDTRPGDDSFVSRYKRNQAYATVSAELSFYPYAKMFYRAKDANDNLQDVFVTSENLSKMSVFNAMQVGIYKKNEINANLTSTQWSTHARSLTFLEKTGVSDKKSVLPGGAIQDIDMGNQGDTQLGLRLWQTCLPDGQVEAVQEGFKVSETEARSATDALMESIKTAIGGYGLVQWGTEGVQTDFRSVLSGTELHENTSVPFVLGNSGTTAADDKYYLRHDGSGSSRANFDCLDARIERQNLYTIYSDTDGNVWVTKDGAELGRISITESAETLINKSKELQLLDANTKLITNYVSALDRNKGDKSKYDRYDKNKYNEAFDGVSVLLTDMSFDIGFGQGMAKRTNVLDPLLVAQAESKSDLYNFDDANKVRSSVYVTTTTSTAAEKQQEGYFGTLKAVSGIGDLEIGISDIQSMVYTKNFYIPNATVSDLN